MNAENTVYPVPGQGKVLAVAPMMDWTDFG